MKRLALLILTICILSMPTLIVFPHSQNTSITGRQVGQDRFKVNLVEPDGFLGLRLGNSFRYAEEILGEPDVVRNGSLDWRFPSADFDPYEGLTVLGENRSINGFVAYIRPNRIQFTTMDLRPQKDNLGVFSAKRNYVVGKYTITISVEGQDSEYVRKIKLLVNN